MISVDDFGRLRCSGYFPQDQIGHDDHWQFLGLTWVAQGCGFCDFLALPDAPGVTRCVTIHFADCGPETAARLMRDLGLPLAPGMTVEQVQANLGAPVATQVFVPGRASYEFKLGNLPWTVDATTEDRGGLSYLVIHPPLPQAKAVWRAGRRWRAPSLAPLDELGTQLRAHGRRHRALAFAALVLGGGGGGFPAPRWGAVVGAGCPTAEAVG